MNNLLLQGEYIDIIIELVNDPYNINSVVKLVFIAFCIRNETRPSYGNRKTDFVDVLLDNLIIKLLSHPNELKCIFEALNKLKKCGWISTENGKICILKELHHSKCDNKFLIWCKGSKLNPLIEVSKLDDRAFLEEVLRHV